MNNLVRKMLLIKLLKRIKFIFYNFILWFSNRIVAYIPSCIIRKSWYRFIGIKIGAHSQIDMGVYILGFNHIVLGKNTHINQGCIIDGRLGGIFIGNSVSISHRVVLMTGSHDINSTDFSAKGEKIIIYDHAFIGVNSTILQGVTIGEGAVVCAGSVVTKNVTPFDIVAGLPSKKIGERNHNLNYICQPDRWFM